MNKPENEMRLLHVLCYSLYALSLEIVSLGLLRSLPFSYFFNCFLVNKDSTFRSMDFFS